MRCAILLVVCTLTASAQVALVETPSAVQCEVSMTLAGTMKFDRNNRLETLPVNATGKHVYIEAGTLRKYIEAKSSTVAGVERGERTLPEKHRLIVLDQGGLFSPGGPLTRDELSLVSEHFNATAASSLLPGKAVAVGETWPINDAAVASLCLFDCVVKNTLVAKLDDTNGAFSITGSAEGLENGAKVKVTVASRGAFDLTAKMLTTLTWEQTDDRAQGPVSPAMEAKVTVNVVRKATTDALFAEKIDTAKQRILQQLRHEDASYHLLHDRDWHTVVHTDTHLVLRLVRSGELIAQATITPWKKTDAKPDDAVKEFVAATLKQPGWVLSKVLSSAAMPGESGRTIYRHVAQGKQDEIEVVQSFHLITSADGRRVVVTCVARPEMLEKLGSLDAALAGAVDFPASK